MSKAVRKAFTLIELLVVIAIIGILSGLIVVSMSGVTQKATIAKGQVFSNSLRNSLMLDLVAEYKLDSDVVDSWGGNPTGASTADPITSDCVQGSCYNFTVANSDYIQIPYDVDLKPTSELTVSIWASMTNWGSLSSSRIIGCAETGGYYIATTATSCSGSAYINGAYRSVAFYSAPPASGWHYFVLTYDGRYLKVCLDGVCKTPYDAGATYPISYSINNDLIIGAEAGSIASPVSAPYFDGKIDEFRLFKEAMPSSQIKQQYYTGLNSLFINGGITKEEYLSRLNDYAINN